MIVIILFFQAFVKNWFYIIVFCRCNFVLYLCGCISGNLTICGAKRFNQTSKQLTGEISINEQIMMQSLLKDRINLTIFRIRLTYGEMT
jgi:hypothetical protein